MVACPRSFRPFLGLDDEPKKALRRTEGLLNLNVTDSTARLLLRLECCLCS